MKKTLSHPPAISPNKSSFVMVDMNAFITVMKDILNDLFKNQKLLFPEVFRSESGPDFSDSTELNFPGIIRQQQMLLESQANSNIEDTDPYSEVKRASMRLTSGLLGLLSSSQGRPGLEISERVVKLIDEYNHVCESSDKSYVQELTLPDPIRRYNSIVFPIPKFQMSNKKYFRAVMKIVFKVLFQTQASLFPVVFKSENGPDFSGSTELDFPGIIRQQQMLLDSLANTNIEAAGSYSEMKRASINLTRCLQDLFSSSQGRPTLEISKQVAELIDEYNKVCSSSDWAHFEGLYLPEPFKVYSLIEGIRFSGFPQCIGYDFDAVPIYLDNEDLASLEIEPTSSSSDNNHLKQ